MEDRTVKIPIRRVVIDSFSDESLLQLQAIIEKSRQLPEKEDDEVFEVVEKPYSAPDGFVILVDLFFMSYPIYLILNCLTQ